MDRKERTIGKEVHLAKTSPHRDRGWQTDYPRVGSGRDLGFANTPREECNPARVWLANNVQVLRDITSAKEEAASPPGKFPSPPAGGANRVGSVLGRKRKADPSTPKAEKRVRMAMATVDLEEELAEVSRLLEGVRDEAVEAERWVRAVEACV